MGVFKWPLPSANVARTPHQAVRRYGNHKAASHEKNHKVATQPFYGYPHRPASPFLEEGGALDWIRTSDLQLRRLPLYPTELRARLARFYRTRRGVTKAIEDAAAGRGMGVIISFGECTLGSTSEPKPARPRPKEQRPLTGRIVAHLTFIWPRARAPSPWVRRRQHRRYHASS